MASFEFPPDDWGKKPSPIGTLSGGKSDRPQSEMVVVVDLYLRRFAHAAAPVINLVVILDLALKI